MLLGNAYKTIDCTKLDVIADTCTSAKWYVIDTKDGKCTKKAACTTNSNISSTSTTFTTDSDNRLSISLFLLIFGLIWNKGNSKIKFKIL